VFFSFFFFFFLQYLQLCAVDNLQQQ